MSKEHSLLTWASCTVMPKHLPGFEPQPPFTPLLAHELSLRLIPHLLTQQGPE